MQFAGYDPANYPLNQNEWSFPVCEVFYIAGFALLIGTIFIVDLRLMGLGMKRESTATVLKGTAPWTLLGLAAVLITGPLIFFSDPNLYMANASFRFKITMLLIAMLYNWTLHRMVANKPDPGTLGVLVGALSAFLWASVIFAGIFIAFV